MALRIGFIALCIFAAVAVVAVVLALISRRSIITVRQVGLIVVSVSVSSSLWLILTSSVSLESALQVAVVATALLVFAGTVYVQRVRSKRIVKLEDLAHLSQMISDLIAGGSDIGQAVSHSLKLNQAEFDLGEFSFDQAVDESGLERALYDLAGLVKETSLHVLIAHLLLAITTGSASVQSAAIEAADQAQLAIERELNQLLALSRNQFELRALSILVAVGVPLTGWLTRGGSVDLDPVIYLGVVGLIVFVAGLSAVWLSLGNTNRGFFLEANEISGRNV